MKPIYAKWNRSEGQEVQVKILTFSTTNIGQSGVKPVAIIQDLTDNSLRYVELKFLTVEDD